LIAFQVISEGVFLFSGCLIIESTLVSVTRSYLRYSGDKTRVKCKLYSTLASQGVVNTFAFDTIFKEGKWSTLHKPFGVNDAIAAPQMKVEGTKWLMSSLTSFLSSSPIHNEMFGDAKSQSCRLFCWP
jgi:hypothetical protein